MADNDVNSESAATTTTAGGSLVSDVFAGTLRSIPWRTIVQNRTIENHPFLDQAAHMPNPSIHNENFCFVVGADCQLGINSSNKEWQTEIEYCKKAIEFVHEMATKPAFICICGDIVDMEPDDPYYSKMGTREDRIEMQKRQFEDFKTTWRALSIDIPLICLCGNHDVGNKPTAESIARYTSQLGDDYFAFWCKGCYNIVLNSNLYFDKSNAPTLFDEQHAWVEDRLKYARSHNARRIFVYAHHPWFMDKENDTDASLTGGSPIFGGKVVIPDAYFFVKYEARRELMQMFKDYGVTACFAGHYHQNLISRSTWGMPMIVTGPLCNWLLESNAKDVEKKENITEAAGLRIVHVDESANGFSHTYAVITTHNVKSFP